MQRGVVMFAALALMLAAGAGLFWQSAVPQTQPVEPEPLVAALAAEPLPPARAELPLESWAMPEEMREEPLPPDPNPGTIRGQLLYEGAQPAAGVQVVMTHRWLHTVVPGPEDREFFARINDARLTPVFARTDAHGKFTLHPVRAGITQFLAIGIGTVLADLRKVEKLPRVGETVELDPIVLARRGVILGRIETGRASLAGTRVRAIDDPILSNPLAPPEARAAALRALREIDQSGSVELAARDRVLPFAEAACDVRGSFHIDGVRPGRVVLLVMVPGMFPQARELIVQSDVTTDAGTITADAPVREVRIRDTDGRPLARAEVMTLHEEVEVPDEPRRGRFWREPRSRWLRGCCVRTDGDGRCQVEWPGHPKSLDPGAPTLRMSVSIRRKPGLPWEATHSESGNDPCDRRTADLCKGVLVVHGADGKPVPTMLRLFEYEGRMLPLELQPREVERGRFEFSGLPRTSYVLKAFPLGCAPIVELFRLGAASAKPADEHWHRRIETGLVLQALPTYELLVRVVDDADRPVAGAELFARLKDEDRPGSRWSLLADRPLALGRTNSAGTLRLPHFWSCKLCIGARRSGGWISAWVERRIDQPTTIELRLRALGEVTGRLVERWVSPHSTWSVELKPMSDAQHPFMETRRTTTNPDGTFAFHDQVAGSYHLGLTHPDAPIVDLDLSAGQQRFVLLGARPSYLDATAPLSGRCTVDGAAGGGLVLRIQEVMTESEKEHNPVWRDSMFTDNEGLFSFRPQPSKRWQFELMVERMDRGVAQRLARRSWRSGDPPRLDLSFRTGAARIEVAHESGRPLGNQTIVLEQTRDGSARFEAITTARGFTTIERVPVGRYSVRVGKLTTSHDGRPAELEIRPGEDTIARFLLR